MTLRDLPPVRALAEERAAVRISVAFQVAKRFGDASDADKARHHRDNPGELEALALAVLA